jgi:5-bromo-4-chloroindolyl phosphate hydrolysis protein
MNQENQKDEKANQDLAEVELLLEELRRVLKPRDRVEDFLLRAIAEAEWELRRIGEPR